MTAIVKDDEMVSSASEGDEVEIVLDKTSFYGEVGGQLGDTGSLSKEGTEADDADNRFFHESLPSSYRKTTSRLPARDRSKSR